MNSNNNKKLQKYQFKTYKVINLDEDVNAYAIIVLKNGDILAGTDREQLFVFSPEDNFAIIGYTDTETSILNLTELSQKNLLALSCFKMMCIYKYEIISGKYIFHFIQKFEINIKSHNYQVRATYELKNKELLQSLHSYDISLIVYTFNENKYQQTTNVCFDYKKGDNYDLGNVITTDNFLQMDDDNILISSFIKYKLILIENNTYRTLNIYHNIKCVGCCNSFCKIDSRHFLVTTNKGLALFEYPKLVIIKYFDNEKWMNGVNYINSFFYVSGDTEGKIYLYEKKSKNYDDFKFNLESVIMSKLDHITCLTKYKKYIILGGTKFIIQIIGMEDYDGTEDDKNDRFEDNKNEEHMLQLKKIQEMIDNLNQPAHYAFRLPKKKKAEKKTYY